MTLRVLAIVLIWLSVGFLLLALRMVRRRQLESPIAIGFWFLLAAAPAFAGAILLLARHIVIAGSS